MVLLCDGFLAGLWFASGFSGGALLVAFFGAFSGLFEAERFALDVDDFGMVDEPVDEGDDAGRIGEDFVPFGEGSV